MLLLWEPYRIGILAGQVHRSLSSTPVLSYLVKKMMILERTDDGLGAPRAQVMLLERDFRTPRAGEAPQTPIVGTVVWQVLGPGCSDGGKVWFSILPPRRSCSGNPIEIGFWAGRYIEG